MRSEIEENVKTTKKMEWQNYKNAKNQFSMKFRIAPSSMKLMHRLNVVIYDRTAFPLRLFEKNGKSCR